MYISKSSKRVSNWCNPLGFFHTTLRSVGGNLQFFRRTWSSWDILYRLPVFGIPPYLRTLSYERIPSRIKHYTFIYLIYIPVYLIDPYMSAHMANWKKTLYIYWCWLATHTVYMVGASLQTALTCTVVVYFAQTLADLVWTCMDNCCILVIWSSHHALPSYTYESFTVSSSKKFKNSLSSTKCSLFS